jgi:hypothetical protein
MRKQLRDLINQQNALRSTGPKTAAGKQRSSLNAFKHGLSSNHFAMQQHEFTAYEDLTERMLRDLKPVTEPEKQIAQKIVDLNFRLNRITAIENNMLNFDMGPNEPAHEEDEGIARMMGQARAWKQDAHAFEILGRYEARLSKQLLQYQTELERLKAVRKAEAAETEKLSQTTETTTLNPESASFGTTAPAYVMSAAPGPAQTREPLPPPARLLVPTQQNAPSTV